MVDRRRDRRVCPIGAPTVASGCPSRRTVSVAGSPEPPLSITRTAIVWSLPTMPKRGDLGEFDTAVALVRMPCDEDMQRRMETQRGGRGGNVVRDSVGDQDRPADAFGRRVAQRGSAAPRTAACLDWPRSSRGVSTKCASTLSSAPSRFFEFGAHLGRLALARAESIAPRTIDDDRDDVLRRPAVLALRGVEQAEQRQQRRRQRPPGRRAWTPPASGRRRRAPMP